MLLPWPVLLLPFWRPADWLIPGVNRAQDTRWAGVGKRVMSTPIAAMIVWAATQTGCYHLPASYFIGSSQ